MDGSIRVLHVDDTEEFADVTASLLARYDDSFIVETATDPREALDRLAGDIDCIVSDYDMPGMDGIDFLRAVREDYPDLPFVLFTGKGSEEVASEAISAGVTDYLQKRSGGDRHELLANRIRNAVEKYRSQTQLEESRKRTALFFEQSPLGVIEWDGNFDVVRMNDTAEEILGYSEEELQGRSWEAIVPESDSAAVEAVVSDLLDAEGGYHSVNDNVRKDGERITCQWHNRIVTDEHGDTITIFSHFHDITDRREREAQLRQTTARLEALFEHSPNMIVVHDIEGTIVDVNPPLCENTGYDEETLRGMKIWDLSQSFDATAASTLWQGMETDERVELEDAIERRDGETFPVEVHVRRLDLDGEARFMGIVRDITERKEREQRAMRYRQIVNQMQEAACIYDEDGRFEIVNDYLADFYETTPSELEGQKSQLIEKIREKRDGEPYRELLEGEREEINGEIEAEFPTHGHAVVEYQLSRLVIDGSRNGIVGIAREITDRKQRERELKRQNERLEEFASVVSHDLRNPLNVAMGNLELAREECDNERLDTIADAHERMETLIDDLLTLARQKEPVEGTETIDLATTTEHCWRNVDSAEASVVVETDRRIRAKSSRFRQLMENLLRNAVDHTQPGVTIKIGETEREDGFYVADDGPGIPPEEREEVFEQGYSTSEDGNGFGLRIVEQVATAHGWDVHVTESDDGGARFEIVGVEFADEP